MQKKKERTNLYKRQCNYNYDLNPTATRKKTWKLQWSIPYCVADDIHMLLHFYNRLQNSSL
jgi:cytosine/uracil/thiamine/allantoin permease